MAFTPWKNVPGWLVLWALNIFSGIALVYEGYNQGVMGSVNSTPGYIDTMQIGSNGKVTNVTKQGGIVAVYYFGAMFGCFAGGRLADRSGRKLAIIVGSLFAVLGGSLGAGAQNSNMILCARVIAGFGVGFINTVCCILPFAACYFLLAKRNSAKVCQIRSPLPGFRNWP
jgi:MFS family permease